MIWRNWRWVLLGAAVAMAAPAQARAGWAEGLFSESGHDFGSVPRGAKVRHDFVLTNRLGEAVTIVDVRASCGCTSGRAAARVVEPGQSAKVEAEMDTRNFVGLKRTQLIVALMTAGGREAEVRLNVVSNILSDIVLNPGSIDFGNVSKGQAPKAELTIERIGAPGWKAERMVTSSKVLTASLQETARSVAGVTYRLTIGLKAEATAGAIRDEIRILTNDPESRVIPVQVTAQIRGDLTATPASLALGQAKADGAQGRYLVRARRPFAVREIEGAGDGFTLTADDAERKTVHVLSLKYKPEAGSTRGDLRRTFRVRTDLPDEAPLELNATVRAAP